MNIKDKRAKRATKSFTSDVQKSPHFLYISSTEEIDVTVEVPLGFATAGPIGAMIGLGLATLRTLSNAGILGLKVIREKAEEDSERNSRGSIEW